MVFSLVCVLGVFAQGFKYHIYRDPGEDFCMPNSILMSKMVNSFNQCRQMTFLNVTKKFTSLLLFSFVFVVLVFF